MFYTMVFIGNIIAGLANLVTGDFVGAAVNGGVAVFMWSVWW